MGRWQPEEKTQDRALGGGSFEGGIGRRSENQEGPVGGAVREVGGSLGLSIGSLEGTF